MLVSKISAGRADYYLFPAGALGGRQTEPDGRWAGRAARELGLSGVVGGEELIGVLEGRHVADGLPLTPNRSRVRVAAFDLTFSAPKSVSLLFGLSERPIADEVVASHDQAVASVLTYLEDHVIAVRRTGRDGYRYVLPSSGGVVASFMHSTSRALDPHLHTHLLVANLGREGGGADKAWTALDGRGIYAHRAAADALYHSILRCEMGSRLGVSWEMPVNGRADLTGFDREAIREFSRRSAEIAEHLENRGLDRAPTRRARQVAASATRREKDPGVSVGDLVLDWQRRALATGLTPASVERVIDRARVPRADRSRGAETHREQSEAAQAQVPVPRLVLYALEERDKTFTRRDVVRAACSLARPGLPLPAAERMADAVMRAALERARIDHQPGRERDPATNQSMSPPATTGVRARVGVAEPRMAPPVLIGLEVDTWHMPAPLVRPTNEMEPRPPDCPGDRVRDAIGDRPKSPRAVACWERAEKALRSYEERWETPAAPTGAAAPAGSRDGPGESLRARANADTFGARIVEDASMVRIVGDTPIARIAEERELGNVVRLARVELGLVNALERERGLDIGRGP